MTPETLETLRRENQRLREALSRAATNIGNGAFAAPECSLDFFDSVAEEVGLVTTELRRERDEARANCAAVSWAVRQATPHIDFIADGGNSFTTLEDVEPTHRRFAQKARAALHAAINQPDPGAALLERLRCAEGMFNLFEEYHATGRSEAYAEMVHALAAWNAGMEDSA